MNIEPIHTYQLDLKQDFPEDLRLSQAQCQSLENTNKVLTVVLVILGVGLSAAFVYGKMAERKGKQNHIKKA